MKQLITVLLICALAGGCVTTKFPDGRTETRADLDTTIAITQLALTTTEQGLILWMQIQDRETARDQVAFERERADREARIQMLRDTLAELYKLKSESKT